MNKRNSPAPAFLREAFLSTYLFADVFLSRFLQPEGARIIYDRHAEIFCIEEPIWLNKMWDIISSPLFAKAGTSSEFNALVRLSKMYPDKFSSGALYILSLKSVAMQVKEEILTTGQNLTLNATKSIIEAKSRGGDTDCMALMSFLEYHGFFFNQDHKQAMKHMHDCACWNHLFGALMGAKFEKDPLPYHEILCAILADPSKVETLEYLRPVLNISPNTRPGKIASELETAFHRGAFQSCKLYPDMLKMMASCVLNENSKCKIIKHSKSKDAAPLEIPLDIDKATELTMDMSGFHILSEARADEYERISSNLAISDIRASSTYRPLLIVCQDKATFDLYHAAISMCFGNSPFSVLNFAAIGKPSFAQHKENTLITVMEKLRDRNSVLLLEHCEDLSEEDSVAMSKYLSGTYRNNFKLGSAPSVTLDLSGMLPILLTSTMPSKEIVAACDVVIASELYPDEFEKVIDKLLSQKIDLFGLSSLKISDDALHSLSEYAIETASMLLDKVIGKIRVKGKNVMITASELQAVTDMYRSKKHNFSFWGGYHNGNE